MNRLFKTRDNLLDRRYLLYLLSTTGAFLILFTRRPDAVLNPQFWAEDGKVWYADAYDHGVFYSLFNPEAGYYQTISRLVAVFAQLFPLSYGPAIFNFTAIAVKLLVVNFIVSSRLERIVPSLPGRLFIASLYLALPHSAETHANLTNAQWHLALLAFLVLIAAPGRGKMARIFDTTVVTISALSGPFCLLLVPIGAIKYIFDRDRSTLVLLGCIFIGSCVQLSAILTTKRPSTQPLGASLDLLSKIVGGHLFVSAAIGERGHGWIIKQSLWTPVSAAFINLVGLVLIVRAFIIVRIELRLMMVFSLFIVIGALLSPAITSTFPQWTVMWERGYGSRYWLIPIFCWLGCLLYLAKNDDRKVFRYASISLLVLSLTGIVADWRYLRFSDLNFQSHAAAFEALQAGQEMSIPINPDWEMRLTKK